MTKVSLKAPGTPPRGVANLNSNVEKSGGDCGSDELRAIAYRYGVHPNRLPAQQVKSRALGRACARCERSNPIQEYGDGPSPTAPSIRLCESLANLRWKYRVTG